MPCKHGSSHDCRYCQQDATLEWRLAKIAFEAGAKWAKNSNESVEDLFREWWNDEKEVEIWKKAKGKS